MFDYGLTTVNDAGLDPDIIHLMDSLQKQKWWSNVCYDHRQSKNIDLYLKKEFIKRITKCTIP
jgi:hypothetical protein